jgi:hypothetical protein
MKKQYYTIPPEQEYPELDKIAQTIATTTLIGVNQGRKHVKTKCPYPAQCILEMVISKLEKYV